MEFDFVFICNSASIDTTSHVILAPFQTLDVGELSKQNTSGSCNSPSNFFITINTVGNIIYR